MKKILTLVMILTALVACQESMEERAARDARETTKKKCPMPLGNEGLVVLERVTFDIPTRTWKEDLLFDIPEDRKLTAEEARKPLINELKNTPSFKPYMDNGFNFRYVYCRMSNPKDTIMDLLLTKKDYR